MRTAWYVFCLLSFSTTVSGQELNWEVIEDLNGANETSQAITLSGNGAIFIGNTVNPGVNDFVIQSRRRTTGSLKWTDRIPTGTGVVFDLQIASAAGRVFASGYVAGTPPFGMDIAVRAYDAPTGTLLWSDVWNPGQEDHPAAIAAGPAAVVVAGSGGNAPTEVAQFIVRAYDPISGAVLWEDRVQRGEQGTRALGVTIAHNRVFVVGDIRHSSAPTDMLVRAYHASSGALLWERTVVSTNPRAIEASAGRVFLAGSSSPPAPAHSYVGAFNASSGAPLWEEHGTEPKSEFRDLAVDGNRVAAAGLSGSGLLVRVYDAPSGTVEWQDQTFPAPGYEDFGGAVALNGQAVYVAGRSGVIGPSPDRTFYEIAVWAYDAVVGTLLWDDHSHSSVDTFTVDVALGNSQLFVLGHATGAPPKKDFVIRAYGIRNDGIAPRIERVSQ